MNFPANPLSVPTQDQIQAQLTTANHMMQHAIHAVGEMTALNMAAAKASMQDSVALMTKVVGSQDFGKAYEAVQSETKPAAGKVASYVRHATDIGTQAQAEVFKSVQARVEDTLDHINRLIDTLAKSAPHGAEPMAAALKGQTETMLEAYDRLAKANHALFDGYQQQLAVFIDHFAPVATPVRAARQTKSEKATVATD